MAITHLLDTSVYCQPIKKQPLATVEQRWRALGDHAVSISIICEAELLQGLEMSQSQKLWNTYERVLKDKVTIFPVDFHVAKTYAKLVTSSLKKGKPRPSFDLLIAATAKAHDLILATCNYRDFQYIEGLAVEDWSDEAGSQAK